MSVVLKDVCEWHRSIWSRIDRDWLIRVFMIILLFQNCALLEVTNGTEQKSLFIRQLGG